MMKILITLLAILLGLNMGIFKNNVYAQSEELDLKAKSAMVVDTADGQILYESNSDEVRAIASLTKMIVQYIVLEEINQGALSWDEPVEVSPFLSELSTDFILANVPLSSDETYTVKELFDAMSIYSANAATIALAEHIEGSEEAFVHRMREQVADFGIEDAHIVNATGLHNSYMRGEYISESKENDENLMSARSVMIIAARLLEDYPEILETAEEPSLSFQTTTGPFVVQNWNKMLPGLPLAYPGVRGLKTGTTEAAGQSFSGYAENYPNDSGPAEPNQSEESNDQSQKINQPRRSLLTVVLHAGGIDNPDDKDRRYHETAALFDYGFDEWQHTTLFSNDQFNEENKSVSIINGQENTTTLVAESDIDALVSLEELEKHQVEVKYHPDLVNKDGELQAPVYEGEVVGEAVVTFEEALEFLDQEPVEEMTVPIYSTKTIERDNWIIRQWDRVTRWVSQCF